LHIRRTEPY